MSIISGGYLEIDTEAEQNYGRYFWQNLHKNPDKIMMIDAVTHEKFTRRTVLLKSMGYVAGLVREGLTEGDVVGVCSENRMEMACLYYAALYLGITVAPMNYLYSAQELNHSMSLTTPKIVFCSPNVEDIVVSVASKLKFVKAVVVFGISKRVAHKCSSEFVIEHKDERQFKIPVKKVNNPKENIALLLSSSGTTGLPKSVQVTQSNIYYIETGIRKTIFSVPDEQVVMLGLLPWFHSFGCLAVYYMNVSNILMVYLPKFEERLFLSTIQNYKITSAFLVPPLMVFLTKNELVDEYDLSSLKEILCGAAPLGRETELAVWNKLPNIKCIRQGYGMTEGLNLLIPTQNKLPGSIGSVTEGTTCKVVDPDTGKLMGVNEEGELYFKGGQVMSGYYRNPKATKESFDEEGFLRTGDIGYYNERHEFFIVDRLKELIKYNGYQVPPAELEALLLTNPKINDAAVAGKLDESCGELPVAFVVKQANVELTEAEVIEFVARQTSPAKRLHGGVRFVEDIPKNPSGKILRRILREVLKNELNSKL